MNEVVIKIFQGSVVTQTVLGGLTVYPPVAVFYSVTCEKIWWAVEIINSLLFGALCMSNSVTNSRSARNITID